MQTEIICRYFFGTKCDSNENFFCEYRYIFIHGDVMSSRSQEITFLILWCRRCCLKRLPFLDSGFNGYSDSIKNRLQTGGDTAHNSARTLTVTSYGLEKRFIYCPSSRAIKWKFKATYCKGASGLACVAVRDPIRSADRLINFGTETTARVASMARTRALASNSLGQEKLYKFLPEGRKKTSARELTTWAHPAWHWFP